MRIGEESLPPRFGISDLPPDSGDVTLDTCDDVIPYFVMDRKGRRTLPKARAGLELRKNSRRTSEKLIGGPTEAKEPQKRHVQGSDGRNR